MKLRVLDISPRRHGDREPRFSPQRHRDTKKDPGIFPESPLCASVSPWCNNGGKSWDFRERTFRVDLAILRLRGEVLCLLPPRSASHGKWRGGRPARRPGDGRLYDLSRGARAGRTIVRGPRAWLRPRLSLPRMPCECHGWFSPDRRAAPEASRHTTPLGGQSPACLRRVS